MSFFDEDDEPTAPLATRTQTRVRPRRARVRTGPSPIRRRCWSAASWRSVVGALVLFVARLLRQGVQRLARTSNALRDYNRQVAGIATASRRDRRVAVRRARGSAPARLAAGPLPGRSSAAGHAADKSLEQAQDLSVPGDMTGASRRC